MSGLRIIFTLLIFISVGVAIYWKRHWIDKKLQKTWTALILLIFLIVAFLGVSFFFEFLLPGRPFDWENILRVYGMFSQTLSAYSPEDKSSFDYLYHLILSVIGAFLFAGLLISTFNNVLTQRIEKVKDGLVDYNFSNHVVIIGANDCLLTIIRTIIASDSNRSTRRKIIIVTSRSYHELAPLRGDVGTKIWDNIYYIKDDILDPVIEDIDLSDHFLKRVRIARSSEVYVLSDSRSSECDVDNSRIITSIYKYIELTKSKIQSPINCYTSFSAMTMAIRVCRQLESITVDGRPVFKYFRIIPFDFNMILASKAWKVDIPEAVDIVGFSDMGVAMTKYLLLADHDPNGRYRQINVYLTPQEIEAKQLFSLSYDYESIPDIKLNFIEIEDYADYAGKEVAKSPVVILCDRNLRKNIMITYALQHDKTSRKILVYSSTPVLSGVFSDNLGGNSNNVIPFGNHNQSLEFKKILHESCFMYKIYKHVFHPNKKIDDIEDERYFDSGFDHAKWRLMALRVLLRHEAERTKESTCNQQIAAAVLGGYAIRPKSDFRRFIIGQTEVYDMIDVFNKACELAYGQPS